MLLMSVLVLMATYFALSQKFIKHCYHSQVEILKDFSNLRQTAEKMHIILNNYLMFNTIN